MTSSELSTSREELLEKEERKRVKLKNIGGFWWDSESATSR